MDAFIVLVNFCNRFRIKSMNTCNLNLKFCIHFKIKSGQQKKVHNQMTSMDLTGQSCLHIINHNKSPMALHVRDVLRYFKIT